MADYNLPYSGDETAEYLAKARDFSGEPLGDGLYAGSKTYTAYDQYLNDTGALFKLNPSVALGYAINVSLYPDAKDDPNLIPYSNFESASTEAIEQFEQDGVEAIAEFESDAATAIRNAGGVPLGDGQWGAGKTYTAYNEYLVFNGVPYKPLNIPYTTQGADPTQSPDLENVQPWSNFNDGAVIAFANTGDMQSGVDVLGNSIQFKVGQEISSGMSKWRVINSAVGLPLSGGLYAKPLDCVSVADFGLDDTAIEEAAELAESLGHSLLFAPGNYTGNTVAKTVNVNVPATFSKGALLTITNSKFIFNKGVDAGWYKIFVSPDNLEGDANWVQDVSVKIIGDRVKVDWFAEKSEQIQGITGIPDQTNTINQAFRAAVGNYEVNSGSAGGFKSETAEGVLELGQGYYRVDKRLRWGTTYNGEFYRVSGFRLRGQGIASSYLVRTDMDNLDFVLYGAFYTAEATRADNFKITCYNPDLVGNARYESKARALAFFQGDSLILDHIWVSGAQIGVTDANGVERNGIGMQFASCVDTYISNIFTEFCVTGLAFGSAIVTGTNIEIYNTFNQAIGMGVLIDTYDDLQTSGSRVSLTGIQGQSNRINAITSIESGADMNLKMSDSSFDGFDAEFGTAQGNVFAQCIPGSILAGAMTNVLAKNYRDCIFDGGSIGCKEAPLTLTAFKAQGQTNQDVSAMFFNAKDYINVQAQSITLQDFASLITKNSADGYLSIDGCHLSNYRGITGGTSDNQLIVQSGDCELTLKNITRNPDDTQQLNQLGYVAGGSVYTDLNDIHMTTMTLGGTVTREKAQRVSW